MKFKTLRERTEKKNEITCRKKVKKINNEKSFIK